MQAGACIVFPSPSLRLAEETGQERYESGADQGDSAAGHELLHACDQAKRVVPGGEDLAPGLSLP